MLLFLISVVFFKLYGWDLFSRHMYIQEFNTKIHEFTLSPLPHSLSHTKWDVENTKQRNQHGFFRFPAIATGKERILIYINLIKHYWSKAVTSKEEHAIWSSKETPEELCRKTGIKHKVISQPSEEKNWPFFEQLLSETALYHVFLSAGYPIPGVPQGTTSHIYKQAVLRQEEHKHSASYLWKLSGFPYVLISLYSHWKRKCHNCLYTSVPFCFFLTFLAFFSRDKNWIQDTFSQRILFCVCSSIIFSKLKNG